MSGRINRSGRTSLRKPELVSVRMIAWDESQGLYGILCEFSDGETVAEMWGTLAETEVAVAIRKEDIRSLSRPAAR
jgi:hypothetical protein